MLNDIQKRIMELKKEKDVCILAHCYQTHDILEVADFVGDSFRTCTESSEGSQRCRHDVRRTLHG